MTYRTLVVVGNANGAGGFGMGRGANPAEAVARGIRSAKRNLVVVDRFKNAGLVHTVEGRHNNCKVVLRAVPPGYGMKGSRTAKAVETSQSFTPTSLVLSEFEKSSRRTLGNRQSHPFFA